MRRGKQIISTRLVKNTNFRFASIRLVEIESRKASILIILLVPVPRFQTGSTFCTFEACYFALMPKGWMIELTQIFWLSMNGYPSRYLSKSLCLNEQPTAL